MDGASFIEVVQTASSQNLKQATIMLKDTPVPIIIANKKLDQTLSQKVNEFNYSYKDFLNGEVRKLKGSRDELMFNLLTTLARRLHLSLASLGTTRGLHDLGDAILQEAASIYSSIRKDHPASSFNEAVCDFFQTLFVEIDKLFPQKNSKKMYHLELIFQNIIASFTTEQQDQLKKELHITELSQPMIASFIHLNGTTPLYKGIMATTGFTLIRKSTALFSSASSLLSTTSPQSDPIIITAKHFSQQPNTKREPGTRNKFMTFLTVLQLSLSTTSPEKRISEASLVKQWQAECQEYMTLHTEMQRALQDEEQLSANVRSALIKKTERIKQLPSEKKKVAAAHRRLQKDLEALSLEELHADSSFFALAEGISKLKATITNRNELNWMLSNLYQEETERLIVQKEVRFQTHYNQIFSANNALKAIEIEINETDQTIFQLQRDREKLESLIFVLQSQLAKLEMDYPGINYFESNETETHLVQ